MTNLLLILILLTLLFGKDLTIALFVWIWDINDAIGRFALGAAIAVTIISGPFVILLAYVTGSSMNSMLGYTALLLFGYAYLRFVVAAIKSFAKSSWNSLTASQRVSILKARAETRRLKQKNERLWSRNDRNFR